VLNLSKQGLREPSFDKLRTTVSGETMFTHGQILGGTLTTPDLDLALTDYRDRLGMTVVEQGTLPADLTASWATPASTGARFATLQPTSGAPCFLRLVEQATPPDFIPMRTYGWAAFEITVQDVHSWPAKLAGSGFDIVGPPKEIEGLPFFVAMQMTGRGREMIYLNEVRQNTPSSDLPKAASPVDQIFIVILACADRSAALDWYREKLKLDVADTYDLEYTMINKAFALPDGTQSTITMIQKGRLPIIEVDGYPDATTARPGPADALPAGNAIVTLAVDHLDALALDWLLPPAVRNSPFYANRRAATVRGPAGELLELIEISA
jgi:catechol 2,3-dioxygenase-like lactoylglutathione lyase family enzyme